MTKKEVLTRTGVGPFEIGVKICSLRCKTGLRRCGVVNGTVVGVIGDK